MNVLEITDLHKSFASRSVIDGLTLNVPEHAVFGFVGPNGAGKTTTMKMILGLLKADGGSIRVCGESVRYGETKTNRLIGYLPDVPEFYGYMRAREYLTLCGNITGMKHDAIKAKSAELLSLVGLEDAKQKIGGYSRGMKQRLGIAQALLNEPKLLICDEPTSALDPLGRKEILDILSAVKGKTTVLFSTHILSDVERVCDHVAVLGSGTLRLNGTLSEIRAQHRHNGFTLEFATEEDADRFASDERLKAPGLSLLREARTLTLHIADPAQRGGFVIAILEAQHLVPTKLEQLEPTLESLFLEAVQ